MKKFIVLLLFVFLVSSVSAQEMTVNTISDSTQRDPQIAADADGNYIVAWMSDSELEGVSTDRIYYREYSAAHNPAGAEELAGTGEKPAVAKAGTKAVIVWAENTRTPESIFDVKGKVIPGGDVFTVNTETENSQTNPAVAMAEDGSFVVTWESWYQDGSHRGVYAQRFNSDGTKAGEEFLINVTTEYSQARPSVKYLSGGKFVIVWESWKNDSPDGYGMYGRIFNSDGTPYSGEKRLNTYTGDYQWFGDVTAVNGGGFVAAWCSWNQDGHDGGIYMQKFDSEGEKTGPEVQVNRTTKYYQWLPKVKEFESGKVGVVWSSWQQDGSREGVYARMFDKDLNALSFEQRVNETTEDYQWEPDFITMPDDEFLVVWSSYVNDSIDSEIIMKAVKLDEAQGTIKSSTYGHIEGISTTEFYVHVVDSTATTGHEYEITFSKTDNKFYADITDKNTSEVKLDDFPLDKGEGSYYLSPLFDGIAVEFVPEFDLDLDINKSRFVNNSGTDVTFITEAPSGNTHIAPIDVAVIWGSTETDDNGNLLNPLDTAYGGTGVKEVELPFLAWNLTDNESIETYVSESTQDKKWNPGETITFLTPPQYNSTFPIFHAQLKTSGGATALPAPGDTNFIYTTRPLKEEDVYSFVTLNEYITGVEAAQNFPVDFSLGQNYPNPFNPVTTINFTVPEKGNVELAVYDILGRKVAALVNETRQQGKYRIEFNASGFASGVYIYTVRYGNRTISKKMVLLK